MNDFMKVRLTNAGDAGEERLEGGEEDLFGEFDDQGVGGLA